EVLERSRLDQLVHRARSGLHLFGLRARPLDRGAGVGHLAADPRRRLADPHLRLGRGVLRLHHFLLRAEGFDPRGELLLVRSELLLLVLERLYLTVEILELRLHGRLALERLPCEVLAPAAQRLPRLGLELDDALLELGLL